MNRGVLFFFVLPLFRIMTVSNGLGTCCLLNPTQEGLRASMGLFEDVEDEDSFGVASPSACLSPKTPVMSPCSAAGDPEPSPCRPRGLFGTPQHTLSVEEADLAAEQELNISRVRSLRLHNKSEDLMDSEAAVAVESAFGNLEGNRMEFDEFKEWCLQQPRVRFHPCFW